MAFQQFRAAGKKKGSSKPTTDSSLSAIFDTIAKATTRASRVNRDGTILALHQALPAEVREAACTLLGHREHSRCDQREEAGGRGRFCGVLFESSLPGEHFGIPRGA